MKHLHVLVTAVTFGLAVLTIGCQTTPKVRTEVKPGVDFPAYRTFALLPLPQSGPAADPGLMLRIAEPARKAVVESLKVKGFAEAPQQSADFCVHLFGQVAPKVDVTDYGFTRPVLTRHGMVMVTTNPDTRVYEYEERTLTIEILDNARKEVVWVGWSKREASGPVKPENVTKAISNILAQFPPPSAADKK